MKTNIHFFVFVVLVVALVNFFLTLHQVSSGFCLFGVLFCFVFGTKIDLFQAPDDFLKIKISFEWGWGMG